VPDYSSSAEKRAFLAQNVEREGRRNALNTVDWTQLIPDERHTWLVPKHAGEFEEFIPIGTKEAKRATQKSAQAIFKDYSNGVKTNSDAYVYNFDRDFLMEQAQIMVDDYRNQLGRWLVEGQPKQLEHLLRVDETILKWIRNTKRNLLRGTKVEFDAGKIRNSLYRPFSKRFYYFERVFNEDIYGLPRIFPTHATEQENRVVFRCGIERVLASNN
jgi:predicted helicase